ncbi:MAG: hypothetical protein JW822_07940 [Spirochaetales bacterium]|nr:hypothetical protein [Spirochaetales bacterium]
MKADISQNIINDLTDQIQHNLKKVDYFLAAKQQTILYTLFIGLKESKKITDKASVQKQRKELLKKTSGTLTQFEKSAQLLIYTTENGILVLAQDFNIILETFLYLKAADSKQKQDFAFKLCMGAEFFVANQSTLIEDIKPALRHAISMMNLAVKDRLLISRAVYEIYKNTIEKNKNVNIQMYRSYRFPNEKIQTDIFELADAAKKLIFPSRVIFGKETSRRLAAGALIAALIFLIPFSRTEVFRPVKIVLQGDLPGTCYLDFQLDSPITSIWDPEYQGFLLTKEVQPGQHILHYDENAFTRHTQRILIQPGTNVIKLNWQKMELPYTYLWIDYHENESLESHDHHEEHYTVFDKKTFQPIIRDIVMDISLRGRFTEKNTVEFIFNYEISENGKPRSTGGRLITRDLSSNKIHREYEKITVDDDHIFYMYQVFMDSRSLKVTFSLLYLDYLESDTDA